MYLKTVRLKSLKRFRDSGEIDFSPGVNIVVGANNVGKTTLVDAICGRAISVPHRSPEATPLPAQQGEPSVVSLTINFSPTEAREILLTRNNYLTAPFEGGNDGELLQALREFARKGGDFVFERTTSFSHLASLPAWNPSSWTNVELRRNDKGIQIGGGTGRGSGHSGDHYTDWLANYFQRNLYAFRAERFSLGVSNFGNTANLAVDANNLPEALNFLQSSNRPRFGRYVSHVSAVFPEITDITIPPAPGNQLVIKLWDTDPALEREDLAVDLTQSGTWIGQVLAMLYVVVTSTAPRTIVIDEPHSFLHPGALRRLFEILSQEYSQHQYIITTNSPTAILAAAPARVVIINRKGHESVAVSATIGTSSDFAAFLDSVGAHLSDVFGADAILWVEGRTEEKCIQQLLNHFAAKEARGLLVRDFVATADIDRKDAEKIFEIYRRLSGGATLLPPALAFIFDREEREPAEIARIAFSSRGLAHFLGRKMYENYLLVPAAIHRLLTEQDPEHAAQYSEESVLNWLTKHAFEARFEAKQGSPFGSSDWYASVHGAKLLVALCSELTETRISYDKVRDGQLLTRYLIESSDDGIRSFVELELKPILALRPKSAGSTPR